MPPASNRFLKAMEERGLVTSAWDLPKRGPAKRLFDVTPDGRACLARWIKTLAAYEAQIDSLIQFLRRRKMG
jgi:PadR family transcriptional regulator PadR